MPSYKLTYFDLRGKAEVIRLMFAAAGVAYEDIRVASGTQDPVTKEWKPSQQWSDMKHTAPFGQIPILRVENDDGTVITFAQSSAIARYVAKKLGFYGKTDEEAALIDMYMDQLGDLWTEMAKGYMERDPERKKALDEKCYSQTFPQNVGFFEKRLAENGSSGYLVGDGFSMVDFAVYAFLDTSKQYMPPEFLEKNFPLVTKMMSLVEQQEGVAKWISVRPKTQH